ECRCVTKTCRSLTGSRPVTPLSTTADFARRTMPAPMSTRYGVSLTTIAVAGPERSGSAGGFPVPSSTTWVRVAVGAAGGSAKLPRAQRTATSVAAAHARGLTRSPGPAGVLPHHRLARLARERLLELLHVRDGADHAEPPRRMRIGLGELTRLGLHHVLAPHVGEAEEEALLRGEAVDVHARLALQGLLERAERHAGAAVVGGVLAQGEAAVQVDVPVDGILDGHELVVLLGDAVRALLEGGEVLRRPPVLEVALGVELAALVVEPVRVFVPDHDADPSEVHGIVHRAIEERRLQDAGREDDLVVT